jgi:copper chaperone CopZ
MEDIEGISDFHVNLDADRVVFVYQPDVITLEQIIQHMKDVGSQIGDVKEVQV